VINNSFKLIFLSLFISGCFVSSGCDDGEIDKKIESIERQDNIRAGIFGMVNGFVGAHFLFNMSKILPAFHEKILGIITGGPILSGILKSISSSFTKGFVGIGDNWLYDFFSITGVNSKTLYPRVERTKGLYVNATLAATFMYLTIMNAISKNTVENLSGGIKQSAKSIVEAIFVGGLTQLLEETAKLKYKGVFQRSSSPFAAKDYPFASTLLSSTIFAIPKNVILKLYPGYSKNKGLIGTFSSLVKSIFVTRKLCKTHKKLKPGDKKTGLRETLEKQERALGGAKKKLGL
jgi:hypothetical protein